MTALAATSGLYPARPTLVVDGEAELELSESLRGLVVEEDAEGLARCELILENWGSAQGAVDFLWFDQEVLDFGRELEVRLGAGQAEGAVFVGRISAIEGRYPAGRAPEVRILAEDRLQDLRMTRRTRSFEQVSDADLVQRVAQEHGLSAQVELPGPTHAVVAQLNQSDLAFLRDRVRAAGGELWARGRTLHAQRRPARSGEPVTLRYGERLLELAVLADLAHQRTSLSVTGWDVGAKEAIEETADRQTLGAELGGDRSGAEVLEAAFAERKDRLVHTAPLDAAAARALAESQYRAMARRFLTGRGVAEGDARIAVGGQLELEGLGPLFDGTYVVVSARHVFDRRDGLRTQFAVERPGIGGGR